MKAPSPEVPIDLAGPSVPIRQGKEFNQCSHTRKNRYRGAVTKDVFKGLGVTRRYHRKRQGLGAGTTEGFCRTGRIGHRGQVGHCLHRRQFSTHSEKTAPVWGGSLGPTSGVIAPT